MGDGFFDEAVVEGLEQGVLIGAGIVAHRLDAIDDHFGGIGGQRH